MITKSATPKNGDGLIRRKEVAVVLQDNHSEGDDEAVGGIAGDHIDLMFLECSVEQAQIHDARRGGELQSIGARQARVTVGAFHEFVTKTGAPSGSVSDEVRDGAQFEFLRVFIANHNGKRIVESERRANLKTEAIPVGISNRAVDRLGV